MCLELQFVQIKPGAMQSPSFLSQMTEVGGLFRDEGQGFGAGHVLGGFHPAPFDESVAQTGIAAPATSLGLGACASVIVLQALQRKLSSQLRPSFQGRCMRYLLKQGLPGDHPWSRDFDGLNKPGRIRRAKASPPSRGLGVLAKLVVQEQGSLFRVQEFGNRFAHLGGAVFGTEVPAQGPGDTNTAGERVGLLSREAERNHHQEGGAEFDLFEEKRRCAKIGAGRGAKAKFREIVLDVAE